MTPPTTPGGHRFPSSTIVAAITALGCLTAAEGAETAPLRAWSADLLRDVVHWPHSEREARVTASPAGLHVEIAGERPYAIAAVSGLGLPPGWGRIRVRVAEMSDDARWFVRLFGKLRQPGEPRTAAIAQDESEPGERVFPVDPRLCSRREAPLQLQLGVEGPKGAFVLFEDVAFLPPIARPNRRVRESPSSGQRDIEAVKWMPDLPEPYELIDRREKARSYDRFVFDFRATGEFLPLVWLDESRTQNDATTFGLPSYVGDPRWRTPGGQEGITCMGAVLGATLVGIDKSRAEHDYVRMCEAWFHSRTGLELVLNLQRQETGGSFWYEIWPHVVLYALADRYPDRPRLEEIVRTTADRWHRACEDLADADGTPDFDHTSYDPVGGADGTSMVVRGGSHHVHLQTLRSANRSSALPSDRHCLLGFRVVRVGEGRRRPDPVRTTPKKPWATDVSERTHVWSPDRTTTLFEGPTTLYAVSDAYGTPELDAQFRVPLYTHNHSPAITWCRNGDLLLVWFSGESEKGQELTILGLRGRRQPDGSLRWDPEVSEFFKAADRNMHGSQLWNNAFRIAGGSGEPFTLYHVNGVSTDGRWTRLAMSIRRSTDHGATWTAPAIMKQETDALHLASARNQPQGNVVPTRAGAFLCFSDGTVSGGSGSCVNFSDDGGRTWSVRGEPGPPGIHAAGVELEDGRLLAFSRGKARDFPSLPRSVSTDQGRTWSAEATGLPPVGTVQRVALLRLDHSSPILATSGSRGPPLLLVSFADDGIPGTDATGRETTIHGTFIALSRDGGQSWPIRRVLSEVEEGSETHTMAPWNAPFTLDATHAQPRAYWAATQTPDGVVHLTDGRLYYAFNLAWVLAGKSSARS